MTTTAERKTYADYVDEDMDRIIVRAQTLYALSKPAIPWPIAGDLIRKPFEERAADELWAEGALHIDPSLPYYESGWAS
jgi:hypothetical protein